MFANSRFISTMTRLAQQSQSPLLLYISSAQLCKLFAPHVTSLPNPNLPVGALVPLPKGAESPDINYLLVPSDLSWQSEFAQLH